MVIIVAVKELDFGKGYLVRVFGSVLTCVPSSQEFIGLLVTIY